MSTGFARPDFCSRRKGDSEPFQAQLCLADGRTGRSDIETAKFLLSLQTNLSARIVDEDCTFTAGPDDDEDGVCGYVPTVEDYEPIAATASKPVKVYWQIQATLADGTRCNSPIFEETIYGNL